MLVARRPGDASGWLIPEVWRAQYAATGHVFVAAPAGTTEVTVPTLWPLPAEQQAGAGDAFQTSSAPASRPTKRRRRKR